MKISQVKGLSVFATGVCLAIAMSAQAGDKSALMGWGHPAISVDKEKPAPATTESTSAVEHPVAKAPAEAVSESPSEPVAPVAKPRHEGSSHESAQAPAMTDEEILKAHAAMMAPALSHHGKASHHAIHWGYSGIVAPQYWGDIKEEYRLCSEGKSQSPIDISSAVVTSLPGIQVAYRPVPLDIVNNGHAIQVNYAPGSAIRVGGKTYELLQFHFHSPSEHTIGGKAHDMVAHLVHKAADGQLAVIAVMIDGGAAQDNPFIESLWKYLPAEAGQSQRPEGASVNVADLLPADLNYFNYSGSLTTPPCSEGVNWFVLTAPVQISDAQLARFREVIFNDARPVQPVNGRTVRLGN